MLITTPKDRPILFSGAMVRAILDDRKTQTRRIVKPQPTQPLAGHVIYSTDEKQSGTWRFATNDNHEGEYRRCPYGLPGDRLWVRETFTELRSNHYHDSGPREKLIEYAGRVVRNGIEYRVDATSDETERCREELGYQWKPSIFMPRWASRITLEVTTVRVERLQEITEADAQLEGFAQSNTTLARSEFIRTWKLINGVSSWSANPWVWVVSFKRVTQKCNEPSS